MGLQLLLIKKISLLFLLISASVLSTAFAGRRISKSVNKLAEGVDAANKEKTSQGLEEAEACSIHERILKANTKDYGKYDPSPTFVKPPFKLIPN